MRRDSRSGGRSRQGTRASGPGGRTPRPGGAILFDFNGVLMEDEGLHCRAYLEILRPLGIAFDRRQYEARYLPYEDRTAVSRMLEDAGREAPPALVKRLVAVKRRRYRAIVRRERVMQIEPAVRRLVRRLARTRALVIVSGAARAEIVAALEAARLRTAFRFIIAAENVRRGKPDPEGYKRAIERLGPAARNGAGAMAIEDSPSGIRAARGAGLPVLGVASSYRPKDLKAAGAFAVVPSLSRPGRFLDG